MAGSGKSEVARVFDASGFTRIRFGDLTDREVLARGLQINEENERTVRESLREEHGMAAYAILNLPEIEKALEKTHVVIDGLYSWEEYTFLKGHFGRNFSVVAVISSPATRYQRLTVRSVRGLTAEDAAARDKSEIENIHKAGPIAMADYSIINESFLDDLQAETKKVIGWITE